MEEGIGERTVGKTLVGALGVSHSARKDYAIFGVQEPYFPYKKIEFFI